MATCSTNAESEPSVRYSLVGILTNHPSNLLSLMRVNFNISVPCHIFNSSPRCAAVFGCYGPSTLRRRPGCGRAGKRRAIRVLGVGLFFWHSYYPIGSAYSLQRKGSGRGPKFWLANAQGSNTTPSTMGRSTRQLSVQLLSWIILISNSRAMTNT